MIAKFLSTAVVVLALVTGLTFFLSSQQMTNGLGVTQNVKAAGVTFESVPWQMGKDAVARGETLVKRNTTLLPGTRIGDYAADYTGFVGHIWQLPLAPELADTAEWSHLLRTKYGVEVPYQTLQAGDILINPRGEEHGQAVVFVRWSDAKLWNSALEVNDQQFVRDQLQSGIKFVGYELDRFSNPVRVVERTYTLKNVRGAVTIVELEEKLAGPYYALRNKRIAGYVELFEQIQVLERVKAGSQGLAQFAIINRGGTPLTVVITAVAYGPDAEHQGIAGTATVFPNVTRVLQPGEVYEYGKTTKFDQAGTYLVLPSFEINGSVQQPIQPARFQVLDN